MIEEESASSIQHTVLNEGQWARELISIFRCHFATGRKLKAAECTSESWLRFPLFRFLRSLVVIFPMFFKSDGHSTICTGFMVHPTSIPAQAVPIDTNDQTAQGQQAAKSSPTACTVNVNLFPTVLHYLLADLELDGLSHIASFQSHGRAFRVHKPDAFVTRVLPNWFSQKNFASFQRQLNVYGFQRITAGPDKHAYYHEKFLRGQPHLAGQIARTAVKGKGPRKAMCVTLQPNFFLLPHLPPTEVAPRVATTAPHRANVSGTQMHLPVPSSGALRRVASTSPHHSLTSGSAATQGVPPEHLGRTHLASQRVCLGQNAALFPSTTSVDSGFGGHFGGRSLSSLASPFPFGNGPTPHYTSFQTLPATLVNGCLPQRNDIPAGLVQEFIRCEQARQIAEATTIASAMPIPISQLLNRQTGSMTLLESMLGPSDQRRQVSDGDMERVALMYQLCNFM